jgi:hypothetical protein
VRALARDLQVPLLVLDSNVLAPYVRLVITFIFYTSQVFTLFNVIEGKVVIIISLLILEQDFGDDCASECESDDEDAESGEECTSESEVEDENDVSNEEEWTSSGEASAHGSDIDEVDVQATAEAALKKLIPYNHEEFEKVLVFWSTGISC